MKTLKYWRDTGTIILILLGCLIHFVFSWTGSSPVIGFFVPVNESVWEHLKLGYWSVAMLSLADFSLLRKRVNNYFLAKVSGMIALEMTVLAVFYGYHFLAGKDMLIMDIMSYVAGCAACQSATHRIMTSPPLSVRTERTGFAAFIAAGLLLGVTTYHPPHLPIFRDSRDFYGIPVKQ